ncbi:unnamed protein product [Rotaria sordida]|uniref:Nuclear receptor domain-containing protein n=1 Tax=Rotaria sordida TaxID=392033 RepID=A0A815KEF1_9BILA|nr:unnamed protein product [Rotaria sordida]CAF1621899.1 unnamed protein product [Rotaria sordida]
MERTPTEDPTTPQTPSTNVERQKNPVASKCKVCGASARYSYYGAIVCHSCKMFFKRNAQDRQATLKCHFNNDCDININTRHTCASCRLAKCFINGMCIELIRSHRPEKSDKNEKTKLTTDPIPTMLVTTNDKQNPEHIETLNILESDQSTLTLNQWNLLSNLVYCFDENSGYAFVENFIEEQNRLPLKLRFKYSSVYDLFKSMMGNIQLVFEKNRDFLSLSRHDRTTLLRTTAEFTTSIGGMFTLRQYKLFDYPPFYESAEIIFHPTAAIFIKRVIDQLDPDNTFIKLILSILAFSTINYTMYKENIQINLTNIKAILPIQDMYIDLTWRYLLYKYGHHQAAIRLSNLVKCLFAAIDAIIEAHESQKTPTEDSATSQILCTNVKRQKNPSPSECKICGSPARYSYYGVIVCHSCKMFFKRNAQDRQVTLKCHFNNDCDININTRHTCASCRLEKCLKIGMCIEMIRSSRCEENHKNEKRKLIVDSNQSTSTTSLIINKKHKSEHIPRLSLLESDQSTLSINQWNFLSNLVYCFDENIGYEYVKHCLEEQNRLPIKLRFKYSPFKLHSKKNRDILSLFHHDRTTLLRTAVEFTTDIGGMFTLRQYKLFDYPPFYESVEMIFKPSAAIFIKRVIDQLDPDNTFIKLILSILAFSTINYTMYRENAQINLINIKETLRIQDMYVDLAWQYLLYKYGHHEAVIRFSNLIRYLFFL